MYVEIYILEFVATLKIANIFLQKIRSSLFSETKMSLKNLCKNIALAKFRSEG